MGFTAVPSAGAKLRRSVLASLMSDRTPLFVKKTSDETVNNSSTLQDDNELVLAGAASTTYDLEMRLIVNTGTTPDLKFTFTVPSGTTGSAQLFTGSNPDSAASGLQGPFSITATAAASGVGADQVLIVTGIVVTSSTAGNVQLQWAQNVANLSDTKVKADSYLILRKVA